MTDLLSSVQVLLREVGFSTRLISFEEMSLVCFEDDTLLGFSLFFETPAELIERWKTLEMSLLKRYSGTFRAAGEKAWNVYMVLLVGAAADEREARQIRWIEEDLERTRKLTASGVSTTEDVRRALLPILPLQHQPVVEVENVAERLQRRIRSIAPKAAEIALSEDVSPEEVVRLLQEMP